MSDDIVTRLRVLLSKCCIAPAMGVWSRELRDAADEIELLRSTLTDCRIKIESIRAQRDEARREICMNATKEPYRQMCGIGILLPQDAARERGWDCFKEDGK